MHIHTRVLWHGAYERSPLKMATRTPSLREDPALEPFVISSVRPTGKILGRGAYGEVLEAKIPGATCAVKKLHDILQTEDEEWVDPQMVGQNRGKFISECQLMSRLRHPHIVQFLGIVFFPGSDTPALVTERLLTDLHSLLLPTRKGQRKPYIPLGLKYSILHDVSQGLFFLHSRDQPIIHRDLTAANVLLNSAMVAKIADLGMARLMPMVRAAMTKGPGNAAYMPPEAQEGRYDVSIDIFSFGVLALFALTQTFPDPLPATYTDRGKVEARTEVQRRSAFIAQIPSESHSRNPLVGIIEQCLDNIPAQRPKMQRVLELMEAAKAEDHDTHTQMNKLELVQAIEREREELVQQHNRERVELMQQNDREREEAIQQKDREREEAIQQKDREREEAIQQKDREREEAIRQKDREKEELLEQNEREKEDFSREKDREWEEAITQKDREREEAISQKDREREEAISQKDREREEAIVQKEGEREEAVQQKEREIVDELMGVLGVGGEGEVMGETALTKDLTTANSSVEVSETKNETSGTADTMLEAKKQRKSGAAVLIVGSVTPPPPQPPSGSLSSYFKRQEPEIVPLSRAVLSGDDHQMLTELGLPPDKWDNLNVLLAMYNRAELCDVFSVQVSKPGMELSRSYVLEQVEYLLMNSVKKEEAVIHYYGNGRRNTGDWCFGDGFITFRDIAGLYMKHSCCRPLTIVSDCCYSASWETECAKFLDEEGVRPCGHSATEKGILLKVYTPCRAHQSTVRLCYATKVMKEKSDITVSSHQKPPKHSRAVFILGSVAPHANESVVPQSPAVLSGDDRQMLIELGLPPDKWDNLNVRLAMHNRAEAYDVFSVQVSKLGMELSRSYVLEQVEYLLMNSVKKEGAIIHYYGNGRRNTGDWCFRDGFITFRDIADLYMKHSRGRILYLVPDCHSSGHWVVECAKFLDEEGVRPCGHSATEKGILLKVLAACRTGQDTAELCYTTRGMGVESDGLVYHWSGRQLSDHQNSFGVDFTKVRCGKGEGEECAIASDSTWSTDIEVTSGRIHIVRATDNKGRPAWHYVLLDDDAEKIKEFKHKTQGENAGKYTLNLKKYGTVLRSGWGKDPPQDLIDKYGAY